MGRLTRKHESGEFYLPRRYKDENGNNIVPSIQDAINKLAHYEDMEELGRLIELPCAVGDTVWKITTQRDTFDDREYPVIIQLSFRIDMLSLIKKKIIFLTKEEAEAKLEELKGE